MHVLIANTLYYPDVVGGSEVSTQILAEGLVAAGVNVSVVCVTETGEDRMCRINGVNVHYLRLANLYWPYTTRRRMLFMKAIWHAFDVQNVFMARRLQKIVEREKPDIVSTSNLSCLSLGIWGIARRAGLPIVHTIRDYYLMCPAALMFSKGKSCRKQCSTCALYAAPRKLKSSQVDVVIGVSDFILRQHMTRGFFPRASAAHVINDCYLPPHPAEMRLPPPRLPGFGAHDAKVARIGVLGRVSPEKGIEIVAQQLLAQRTLPQWRLYIGGTGAPAYVDKLRRKYADPRIEFMGRVDPRAFFAGIDVLVVPSIWREPFGRVTVEAYAQGVPVVGANSGAIPSVIEPESALVFDIEQPSTLIAKLEAALALRASPGFRERLMAHAQGFRPDRMVDAYLDIYQKVLAAAPLAAPLEGLGQQM
ncbi:MAG: glycosyltransferase family 4 protein [Burkholderiales bacterium]|nr:glycosyltransferase family 4 protein [Burkholderiales bacterium]